MIMIKALLKTEFSIVYTYPAMIYAALQGLIEAKKMAQKMAEPPEKAAPHCFWCKNRVPARGLSL